MLTKFVDVAQLMGIELYWCISIFLQSVILKIYTIYDILNLNQTEQPYGFETLFTDLNGLLHDSNRVSVTHFPGQILFYSTGYVPGDPRHGVSVSAVTETGAFLFS